MFFSAVIYSSTVRFEKLPRDNAAVGYPSYGMNGERESDVPYGMNYYPSITLPNPQQPYYPSITLPDGRRPNARRCYLDRSGVLRRRHYLTICV